MTRKTRANKKAFTSSEPSFESDKFPSVKNQELYETLNIKRKFWTERKVLFDELDPTIMANFKRRGWLPLLDIDHPPLAALIIIFFFLRSRPERGRYFIARKSETYTL